MDGRGQVWTQKHFLSKHKMTHVGSGYPLRIENSSEIVVHAKHHRDSHCLCVVLWRLLLATNSAFTKELNNCFFPLFFICMREHERQVPTTTVGYFEVSTLFLSRPDGWQWDKLKHFPVNCHMRRLLCARVSEWVSERQRHIMRMIIGVSPKWRVHSIEVRTDGYKTGAQSKLVLFFHFEH